MIQLEQILVPTDFSEHSRQAVAYACELCRRFSGRLHVLHVYPPPALASPYVGLVPDAIEYSETMAQNEIDKFTDEHLEQVATVERVVREGVAFAEIIRYARQADVDLIVIGTHGRTGLMHALIGSVAEKVVRKAPCPVLTVRPQGHQFVMP